MLSMGYGFEDISQWAAWKNLLLSQKALYS
jgi:hypothetical protein